MDLTNGKKGERKNHCDLGESWYTRYTLENQGTNHESNWVISPQLAEVHLYYIHYDYTIVKVVLFGIGRA